MSWIVIALSAFRWKTLSWLCPARLQIYLVCLWAQRAASLERLRIELVCLSFLDTHFRHLAALTLFFQTCFIKLLLCQEGNHWSFFSFNVFCMTFSQSMNSGPKALPQMITGSDIALHWSSLSLLPLVVATDPFYTAFARRGGGGGGVCYGVAS